MKTLTKKRTRKTRPAIVNGTVPRRATNASRRPREYVTEAEVERLIKAARDRSRRYSARDAIMILMCYRHGLRVSELCMLEWDQINLDDGTVQIVRMKKGKSGEHPLGGTELRALRALRREDGTARYVFMTERKSPMTPAGFRKMIARLGAAAGFPFAIHPHMLRHGCGYKLANDRQDTRAIQDFLGHKNIMHTVRYTEMSPKRFKSFWRD